MKLLVIILLLMLLACGFGVEHIAHTRQMNRLSRQLQREEGELRTLTQACRTLESAEAVRAAEELRQNEARPSLAKHSPGKPVRGG